MWGTGWVCVCMREGRDRRDTWEGRACCQPAGPLNPTALGKGCVSARACVYVCVCLVEICQF